MKKNIIPLLSAAVMALLILGFGMEGCQSIAVREHNQLVQSVLNENKTARIVSVSQNSTAMVPSYTNMYPDLYAESNVTSAQCKKKTAYLTFDDGPSKNTEKVIKILDKNNIKATFFIIGSTLDKDGKQRLKKMAKDGHAIGVHTYSHKYREIYSSVENFLEDFYMDYKIIYKSTGVKPCIFRFPGGSVNNFNKNTRREIKKEMERRGFTYYDWNVSGEDSVGSPSIYSIVKNIKKSFAKHDNPVILLHDGPTNDKTVSALPEIISAIKQEGYRFDVLTNRPPCQFQHS